MRTYIVWCMILASHTALAETGPAIDQARQRYAATVNPQRLSLLEALDLAIEGTDDAEQADELRLARTRFQAEQVLPPQQAIRDAAVRYQRIERDARRDLLRAYTAVIREAMLARDADLVGALKAERAAIAKGGLGDLLDGAAEPNRPEGIALPGGAEYRIDWLGEPKSRKMLPTGLNDEGRLSGIISDPYGAARLGFAWREGETTEIQPPDQKNSLQASDINDKNQIVGRYDGGSFFWEDGRIETYPTGDGRRTYSFRKLNDKGMILGGGHVWVRSAPGKIEHVATLPRGFGALAINAKGDLAGTLTVDGVRRPAVARFRNGYKPQLLKGLEATEGAAQGLNDAGAIVGWTTTFDNGIQIERGFIYDGGRLTLVETLGGTATHLSSINDRGVAVGYSKDDRDKTLAIIVRDGRPVNLTPISAPKRYVLMFANEINNKGQIRAYVGGSMGCLLTPVVKQEQP